MIFCLLLIEILFGFLFIELKNVFLETLGTPLNHQGLQADAKEIFRA